MSIDRISLGLTTNINACLFDLGGVLTQTAKDNDAYVDGRPRMDGVRTFLAARHIRPSEGSDSDPPDAETMHGLGNRKDQLFVELIRKNGVES